MPWQTEFVNEKPCLQVETDETSSSQDAASLSGTRFLRTGLGLAGLTLIAVSACMLFPLTSHVLVKSSSLAPTAAFNPSLLALSPAGLRPARHAGIFRARATGLHPVPPPRVEQRHRLRMQLASVPSTVGTADKGEALLAKTMHEFAGTSDLSWMNDLRPDPESSKHVPNNKMREVKSGHYVPVKPKALPAPKLVTYSHEMANELGISDDVCRSNEFLRFFSGDMDAVPAFDRSWATPYALAIMGRPYYDNCPFGNGNGYGDGRAISVAEVVAPSGQRWELQLKGGGTTPFSRGGDGRAVLRSSIREFLASEAMHHLGISTTRALSLIVSASETSRRPWYSGESQDEAKDAPARMKKLLGQVMQQRSGQPDVMIIEPCAITTRVAPSFIRVGHLDLMARRASRKDATAAQREEHAMLLQYAFDREYPDVKPDAPLSERALAVYEAATSRIAVMISGWVRVGFCEGNFAADNCLMGGRTMDYGPFGFMDKFDPGFAKWVGSSDHFAFMNQDQAAIANLFTLATSFAPVLDESEVHQLNTLVTKAVSVMKVTMEAMWCRKLGLGEDSEAGSKLASDLRTLMGSCAVDYTILFRQLAAVTEALQGADPAAASADSLLEPLRAAFYTEPTGKARDRWAAWLRSWLGALSSEGALPGAAERLRSVNPKYILREYILVEAYEKASQGDFSMVEELKTLTRHPYDEQPELEAKYYRRAPDVALSKPGTAVMT